MLLNQLPIFVLSDFYLFPKSIFPLMIFEPKYLALLKYATSHKGLFAIAHPNVNRENGIESRLMLAKIIQMEKVPGRAQYLIFVEGQERLSLVHMINEHSHPFKMVAAEVVVDDQLNMEEELQMVRYEKELKDFLIQYNMLHPQLTPLIDFIFESNSKRNEPTNYLLHLIAAHLLTDNNQKKALLIEASPLKRMEILCNELPNLLLKSDLSTIRQ